MNINSLLTSTYSVLYYLATDTYSDLDYVSYHYYNR